MANRGGVGGRRGGDHRQRDGRRPDEGGLRLVDPDAQANPTTSTINFPLGDTRANNFTVVLSGTGSLSGVYKAPAGAKTHLIVDVSGYYK